jgi:hypothetical protein
MLPRSKTCLKSKLQVFNCSQLIAKHPTPSMAMRIYELV